MDQLYSYRQQNQIKNQNTNQQFNDYKVVILGTGAVGKSSITIRYVNNFFPVEYNPTLQDIFRKNFILDNQTGSLEIMDTAGSQEYDVMQDHWIKEGQGFIIVYSIDLEDSFQEAQKFLKRIERIWGTKDMPKVLVGNKCDKKDRKIEKEQGQQLALNSNCPFFETSALTGENCEKIFMNIVRQLRQKQAPLPEPNQQKSKFRKWFEKHCNLI